MIKDKNWLLHEFRKIPCEVQGGHGKVKVVDILPLIDQLDEPKKVVIPQFVADWIIQAKKFGYSISDSMEQVGSYFDTNQYDKAMHWARYNQNIFARAWLDGYEIEKEKLYVVGLMNNHYRITRCLAYDLVDNVFFISQTQEETLNKFKKRFTEKEIKDYDERFWPFAVEVAE